MCPPPSSRGVSLLLQSLDRGRVVGVGLGGASSGVGGRPWPGCEARRARDQVRVVIAAARVRGMRWSTVFGGPAAVEAGPAVPAPGVEIGVVARRGVLPSPWAEERSGGSAVGICARPLGRLLAPCPPSPEDVDAQSRPPGLAQDRRRAWCRGCGRGTRRSSGCPAELAGRRSPIGHRSRAGPARGRRPQGRIGRRLRVEVLERWASEAIGDVALDPKSNSRAEPPGSELEPDDPRQGTASIDLPLAPAPVNRTPPLSRPLDQRPGAVEALQLVRSALLEPQSRAGSSAAARCSTPTPHRRRPRPSRVLRRSPRPR